MQSCRPEQKPHAAAYLQSTHSACRLALFSVLPQPPLLTPVAPHMHTFCPRIRSVLLRPAATGTHQQPQLPQSAAPVAASAGSMCSGGMAGGRSRTFQLLLLCLIGALWLSSCVATIHAADPTTAPATGASIPLTTPPSADSRVPVASDTSAPTATAASPAATSKTDPHAVVHGVGSGSSGGLSGSSGGGAGTGLASRCAVALRHLVVSLWSALSEVDDVVQASVEALARSWKPSTEGGSAHATHPSAGANGNGNGDGNGGGNGNSNGRGSGSPRSPSSTSLSVKTQEIQIYLILCGLVCMLLLVICIGLAWRRYGTLIESLADYNPPQRLPGL